MVKNYQKKRQNLNFKIAFGVISLNGYMKKPTGSYFHLGSIAALNETHPYTAIIHSRIQDKRTALNYHTDDESFNVLLHLN